MKKKPGVDGHFEKLTSKIYDIFFVGGEKPSALKGTKVIDEKKMEQLREKINIPHEAAKIINS